MSKKFDISVSSLLESEGRFVDNPSDPGGATDYGISLRFLKYHNIDINEDGLINIDDIKSLNEEKAKSIYKEYWWDKYRYEEINSQIICTKILDMAVNMGPMQAHKIIQRAINWIGFKIIEDGIIGEKTIDSLNVINKKLDDLCLLSEIRKKQGSFYKSLCESKPALNVFLKGWLKRAEK